jgi:cyclic pyranopterin phosphate synthase
MKDTFARNINYLRVSVTDRCNLRCAYCMPTEGICKVTHRDILSYEEIVEIVRAAADLGIDKVRITGGEPLIRPGVAGLCRAVADIPGIREVVVTTNGILLADLARDLKSAGVSRVNVSLDTLDREKYRTITGGGDLGRVLDGLRAAYDAGLGPLKLNCVLMGGFNDDEIGDFVALTRDYPLDVRFIELMPMGPGASFPETAFLPGAVVLDRCPALQPLPADGGVAQLYGLPDGKGRVGLINPLSCQFCGQCNRIRLTPEGALKPCLHSDSEIRVRGLHGDALRDAITAAILGKPQQHGTLDAHHASEAGREMFSIGG